MYTEGLYNDYIRASLERAQEIREIFNRFRDRPLRDDWLPYNPICEKCGRVNTTEAYDFNGDTVRYRCECGFDGEMDIKSGSVNSPGGLSGLPGGRSWASPVNPSVRTMQQVEDPMTSAASYPRRYLTILRPTRFPMSG